MWRLYGDGIADGACDCDGNVLDCAGVCGGDAIIDDCGVCDGDDVCEFNLSFGEFNPEDQYLYVNYTALSPFNSVEFQITGLEIDSIAVFDQLNLDVELTWTNIDNDNSYLILSALSDGTSFYVTPSFNLLKIFYNAINDETTQLSNIIFTNNDFQVEVDYNNNHAISHPIGCFGELIDFDDDEICNEYDQDDDNDGVLDDADAFPLDPSETLDTDNDGIGDNSDICILDPNNDADGDGICGDVDQCEGSDDNLDADEDGIADGCDVCPFDIDNDIDNDDICGDIDECPFDYHNDMDSDNICGCTITEEGTSYINEDECILEFGLENYDNDNDGDGILNEYDACPNDDFINTGIIGHDWDYGNIDINGCVGACDAIACSEIEGAIWNELTGECGDGICDSSDPCVGQESSDSDCISADVPMADKLILLQNYPNPFNPTSTIKYSIPKTGMISLHLIDVNGRLVKKLINNKYHSKGDNYSYIISAEDLNSGIYFIQLISSNDSITRKIAVIK